MDTRALLATAGSALYSDFLSGGRRRFLNPYIGYRVGYAWIDDRSAFLFGGEVGLELFKHEWVLVDAQARALGFAHKDGLDPAVQVTLGINVPF
jgi:hypothetical protein